MESALITLLQLLAEQGPISTARAARSLRCGQSQLLRLVSVAGEDPRLGSLGLIRLQGDDRRSMLHLTDHGRRWITEHT